MIFDPSLTRCPAPRTTTCNTDDSSTRRRLKTICTANPLHTIPFYHKMMYWENKKIIKRQEVALEKACPRGQRVSEDPLFRFATYVCSNCGSEAHGADACPSTTTSRPTS